MASAHELVTNRKANYLARRQNRSAMTMVILKAQIGQMAYRVQKRLFRMNRAMMAATDPKAMATLNDSCLRCEEMILRIIGHPLPGRARVKEERFRTLDVEPMANELAPPPEPMVYETVHGQNGEANSHGNSVET